MSLFVASCAVDVAYLPVQVDAMLLISLSLPQDLLPDDAKTDVVSLLPRCPLKACVLTSADTLRPNIRYPTQKANLSPLFPTGAGLHAYGTGRKQLDSTSHGPCPG